MKILKLHIQNFGKLNNFELEFNNQFNQFLHENGWGKSTICAFIKAMFYGLEPKGRKKLSQREKFQPWQGGVYGGSLDFEIGKIQYRIYRTFGKKPEEDSFQLFDLTLNSVSYDYNDEIGKQIFGVGEETFEISVFFAQSDLASMLTDEVVANLAGIEKYKNDACKVDNAIDKIEKRRKQLVSTISKPSEIKELENNLARINSKIIENDNKLKEVNNQLINIIDKKEKAEKDFENNEKIKSDNEKIFIQKHELQNQLNEKVLKLNEILNNEKGRREKIYPLSLVSVFSSFIFLVLSILNIIPNIIGYILFSVLLISGLTGFFIIKKYTKEPEKEKNNLNIDIENLKHKMQALPQLQDFNKNLDELIQQLVQQQIVLMAQKNSVINEIENLKEEYEFLQKNLIELKENNELINRNILILKNTMALLNKARDNVSQRFVAPLNKDFKEIFKPFANEDVTIDNQLNVSVLTSQGAKSSEFMSKGYQDLIFICQRFSMIDKIYKKEKPPIILDDTYVNIDDEKFKLAKKTLQVLSKHYQVIYFTCSKSRVV